jgi:hypothetical protein
MVYYPEMPRGTCFDSARLFAAAFPELTYCEGYVTVVRDGKPAAMLSHAWLVDAEGRVIDPTLKPDQGETYLYRGKPRAGRDPGLAEQFANLSPAERRERLVWLGGLAAAAMAAKIGQLESSWLFRLGRWLFPSTKLVKPRRDF